MQEMPAAQALPSSRVFIADLASAAVAGLTWLIVPGLNLLHFARAQPAEVAKNGFEAMLAGKGAVVSGWHNKLSVAAAHVLPEEILARQHTAVAAPGTAKK